MDENKIGTAVIKAAMAVHSALWPGLLESAYEHCLSYELERARLAVRRQFLLPIRYQDLAIDAGYRVDILVEGEVVLELKTVEKVLPVHSAQVLSYLRLGGYKLGYLLNFHIEHMRGGIKRLVNAL